MSHPVVLHVYDLSQGLAKQMSPMLLGKTIDGIWHTGVCVYGLEYFFGGGIQAMPHDEVVATFGMRAVQKIDLGFTDIPKDVFMEFLLSVRHRFTAETYDLFRHNCNNFSDEVSMFLLGRPIPSYITGLPSEVLSTPFGAMIGQMMTGMQQNMRSHMHDPFSAMASTHLPPPVVAPAPVPAVTPSAGLEPRNFTRPLLSTASEALPAVAARLIKLGHETDTSPALFTSEDVSVLTAAGDALKAASGTDLPSVDFLPACAVIKHALETWSPAALTQAYFPALCILRVLVLQEPAAKYWTTTGATVFDSLFTTALASMPLTARVMLFAATSNLFKHDVGSSFLLSPSRLPVVLDAIVAEMAGERAETRKIAITCLHNYVPHLELTDASGCITDVAVQVLNAVFEGLPAETDTECIRRRLWAGERLLSRGGPELLSLATVLEYPASVAGIATRPGLDPTVSALATEIHKMF